MFVMGGPLLYTTMRGSINHSINQPGSNKTVAIVNSHSPDICIYMCVCLCMPAALLLPLNVGMWTTVERYDWQAAVLHLWLSQERRGGQLDRGLQRLSRGGSPEMLWHQRERARRLVKYSSQIRPRNGKIRDDPLPPPLPPRSPPGDGWWP